MDLYVVFCRQSINVSECSSHVNDGYEVDVCEYTAIQKFMHVGSQNVVVHSTAFIHNRTIHLRAAIFYGLISGKVVYFTFLCGMFSSMELTFMFRGTYLKNASQQCFDSLVSYFLPCRDSKPLVHYMVVIYNI